MVKSNFMPVSFWAQVIFLPLVVTSKLASDLSTRAWAISFLGASLCKRGLRAGKTGFASEKAEDAEGWSRIPALIVACAPHPHSKSLGLAEHGVRIPQNQISLHNFIWPLHPNWFFLKDFIVIVLHLRKQIKIWLCVCVCWRWDIVSWLSSNLQSSCLFPPCDYNLWPLHGG